MTYKCKECHCKCHCNEELHADVYGVCTCDNCSCGRKKEEVVDDTQECDVCQ